MYSVLLDEMVVAEQYREPEATPAQQAAVQQGGSAITEITSGTTTITAPGDGSRNIELPQALGTTASPSFNGLTIGAGTLLKKMQTGNVAADPGSIAAQTKGSVDVTVTGMTPGDRVLIQPPDDLDAGLIFIGCRVSASDTLRIYLANITGSPIDGGSRTYSYLWLDFT